MWDGGHQLRKLDFPESTEKALKQLQVLFTKDASAIPGLGDMSEDVVTRIVEDYVFGKVRGKASRAPPALVELQILELILKLFQDLAADNASEVACFSVFQALFGKVGPEMGRVHTLAKLISLALNVDCRQLLDSAAMWMQLQGAQNSCVQLAVEALMHDFTSLSAAAQSKLTRLPELSQHFSCIFISGVTTMCKFPGPAHTPQSRPFYDHFLPMLSEWILNDPRLCLVSLFRAQHAQNLQPQKFALWTSPTKPNPHTPVPGLIRWATQGPLNQLECCHGNTSGTGTALTFQGGSEAKSSVAAVKDNYRNEKRGGADLDSLWSKLHLGVLQTLAVFPSMPGAPQLEVITLADMKKLVAELIVLVHKCDGEESAQPVVETSLDRIVQVVQVALATGAFRCSLADLKNICMKLPETKLRHILESQHLSNNPPAMHNAL